MAKKWVINDGELIIGNTEFHYQLLNDKRIKLTTIGGGRWEWDRQTNIFYFYGKSEDFGRVTIEQFKEAFNKSMVSPHIEKATIIFSPFEFFGDVVKNPDKNVTIPNPHAKDS